MSIRRCSFLVLAFLIVILASRGGFAADKLRISYSGTTTSNALLWVTKEAKLFEKNGIDAEVVYLAGCDKVLNPETKGYKCTVPTLFNKGGNADTGHDWKKEKELLPYLSTYYKTKIKDLCSPVRPSIEKDTSCMEDAA